MYPTLPRGSPPPINSRPDGRPVPCTDASPAGSPWRFPLPLVVYPPRFTPALCGSCVHTRTHLYYYWWPWTLLVAGAHPAFCERFRETPAETCAAGRSVAGEGRILHTSNVRSDQGEQQPASTSSSSALELRASWGRSYTRCTLRPRAGLIYDRKSRSVSGAMTGQISRLGRWLYYIGLDIWSDSAPDR